MTWLHIKFVLILITGPSRAKLGRTAQQQLLTLASLVADIKMNISKWLNIAGLSGHFSSVAKVVLMIWCGTWNSNLKSYLVWTVLLIFRDLRHKSKSEENTSVCYVYPGDGFPRNTNGRKILCSNFSRCPSWCSSILTISRCCILCSQSIAFDERGHILL